MKNKLMIIAYNDNGECYVQNYCDGEITVKCSFDGNMITIYSANDNGRELKAEKYLKKYAQCAMRVFALVQCGKIN